MAADYIREENYGIVKKNKPRKKEKKKLQPPSQLS
jgi:hypothetical protein